MTKHPLERVIELEILHWLKNQGIFAWKCTSNGFFDTKRKCFRKQVNPFAINGQTDIMGVLANGRILCIEVKSKRGKVSDEQLFFINRINEKGGLAFVARSLDQVKEKLCTHQAT